MRALVVGASGQVGSALLAVLEREGFQAQGTHYTRPAPGTVPLDVRDAAAVARCLDSARPEAVFFTVNAPGGVDACEERPELAREVLVAGARHVLEAAAARGAKVVLYSSDYVFDGRSGPYSEEDEPRPLNAYGRAKREVELLAARHPGSLTIRTTAVISWDRRSPNFAMQVWGALSAGKSLRAPSDQWCNPTLAESLAETSVRLLQAGAKGTIHAVGRTRVTRAELAASLAKAMALDAALIVPTPTRELGQRAARPLQGGLKTDKLRGLLGTEPLDLEESLKRLRRHWRSDTYVATAPAPAGGAAPALKKEILDGVRRYWETAHQPAAFVPHKTRIQYSGRVFGAEEMVNLVDSALDFWLTLGPYGDLFEGKLRRYFGARDFVLVNSGSSANLAAVMALMSPQLEGALKAGDEVVTPAVTFPTTLAPIVHGGLIPVFVDCELGTYNIDPALVEAALSPKTRAIMVPHTLGNPCDMDALVEIARRRGLYLIEDTCDALGAKFGGRLAGTFGDLATLSFFPAHHITMGEGGGVVVNNPRLSRIVRSVRDWGRDCWCAPGESNTCGKRFGWQLGGLPGGYDHKYTYSNLGYNLKPTDLQAAIGVAQADRLPDFVARRRRNFDRLHRGLERFSDRLLLPVHDPRAEPSWFAFPITVREGVSRRELVAWLENANIETREVFGGNILKQPGYQDIARRQCGDLANTERVMRDTFFIGVYPGLTEEMIDFVLKAFEGFFARRP